MTPLIPAPGRASGRAVLTAHTRFELTLLARRGEAMVLSLVVPIVGMIAVGLTEVIRLPVGDRLSYAVTGAMALAALATAFTSQAIVVGYERFYGVLKRLGASSLSRSGLLISKTAAIGVLVVGQLVAIGLIGVAVGWRPSLWHLLDAVAVTLLAAAAYSGFALMLASVLRPETTTAVATLVYTLLLIGGGVLFPTPALGDGRFLIPVTAHAEALRAMLTAGTFAPGLAWAGLLAWAVAGVAAARITFRWE